jgi:DNA repair exonuclease SbcCD ATPase subunit
LEDQRRQLQGQQSSLTEQVNGLKQTKTGLESEVSRLRGLKDQLTNAEAESASAQASVEKRNAELQDLNQRLQTDSQRLQTLMQEVGAAEERLRRANSLTQDIAVLDQRKKGLEEDASRLNGVVIGLQARTDSLTRKIGELEGVESATQRFQAAYQRLIDAIAKIPVPPPPVSPAGGGGAP